MSMNLLSDLKIKNTMNIMKDVKNRCFRSIIIHLVDIEAEIEPDMLFFRLFTPCNIVLKEYNYS
jgi:hypothetical protein